MHTPQKSKQGYSEGRRDHAKHYRRDENPYLGLAIAWDRGWRARQVEQLEEADRPERPNDFLTWFTRVVRNA